jgi:hypothetical protein
VAAPTFTVDEALTTLGYTQDDLSSFDLNDRRLLLSALLVKIYFRSNGFSEKDTLAKVRAWPQSDEATRRGVRDNFLEIVRGNYSAWTGSYMASATQNARASGILAAEPTDAQNSIINDPSNYEYYFNSTFSFSFNDPNGPTPFTAQQSTSENVGGLPAPITMASLHQCTGVMRDEVESNAEDSATGIRQELRTLRSYAERRGTRVYAQQTARGFWVAVGL